MEPAPPPTDPAIPYVPGLSNGRELSPLSDLESTHDAAVTEVQETKDASPSSPSLHLAATRKRPAPSSESPQKNKKTKVQEPWWPIASILCYDYHLRQYLVHWEKCGQFEECISWTDEKSVKKTGDLYRPFWEHRPENADPKLVM